MVKIFEDRSFIKNDKTPNPADLICTVVNKEWANKIADVIAKEYGIGVMLISADGKKLEDI